MYEVAFCMQYMQLEYIYLLHIILLVFFMFTSLGHNPFFRNIHGNVAHDGLMLLVEYFPLRYCRAVLECYPHQCCLSFLGPDGVGFHHLNFRIVFRIIFMKTTKNFLTYGVQTPEKITSANRVQLSCT